MDYDDWNRAISAKFFNVQQAHKPVYLFVDHQCLQEIALEYSLSPETAREDFIQAVKSRILFKVDKAQPFFKFFHWRLWETKLKSDPTTPPPFIGLLSLCVLAATEMNVDDSLEVTSSNYYVRLNELLCLSRRGQPPGFDEFEKIWERLHDWLKEDLQGKLGLPTATNTLYKRHVGYPISQALMRRTDIDELADFYHWCGLQPGEENIDSAFFKQQLGIWVSRTTCSFSKQLKLVFEANRKEHIQAVADMALYYYQNWDGSKTIRRDGTRTAEIVLQFFQLNRRSFELALHPRAPLDFPEGVYGSETLVREGRSEWFQPLGTCYLAQWLTRRPIELQNGRYHFKLANTRLVSLRQDMNSELGGWLACSRVTLGEKHLLLCHQSIQGTVETYLKQNADPGWTMLSSRNAIYSNWICFTNVRITKTSHVVQEELECLIPTSQAGIRLSGGLTLKRGVWLKGGEPEAIISTEVPMPLLLNGREVETAVSGTQVIDLRTYNLAEGNHTLQIGERKATFAISNPGNNLLATDRLPRWGYAFARTNDTSFEPLSLTLSELPAAENISSGTIIISGTHILHSPKDPPPARIYSVILPYGARQYLILGRSPGEIFEPELPTALPEWQAGDYLQGYKVQVPFCPQWLITISHRKNVTLRPFGEPEKAISTIESPENMEGWVHWASKRNLSRKLGAKHRRWAKIWLHYGEVARSLR
ncbi:MAG: hypothetical protein IT327_32005 [Anaerolineae bacterium]|nr:hypothetical protein [Anaerolineae bacterium]